MTDRFVILGASRGLGAHFVKRGFQQCPDAKWLLVSRKREILEALALLNPKNVQVLASDFSKADSQETCLDQIKSFQPTRLIYFAAGGPHGNFQDKMWKDHAWSFEVSFLFAARVLHFGMSQVPSLKQIVFTGSAVAEDSADPKAASYSASKHALRGLVRSVRAESPSLDLRLYSPSYMDTDLLPPHAWPRQQGKVASPDHVAQDLLSWLFVNDEIGLRLYK